MKKVKSNILVGGDNTPMIKEVQKVVATGPTSELKIGDWIVLDLTRFISHVKTQSTIKAGIGGQAMVKEQLNIPFFAVPGDDTPYLKISDREIEGTIPNYEALPEHVRIYMTMEEFKLQEEQKEKEGLERAKEAKKRIDVAKGKRDAPKDTYPLIRTDSQKL